MECATGQLDPPPLGYIDDPTNYKFIGGVYPVIGWALDLDIVVKVRILIDGIPQIDAVTGVDWADYGYASPDVAPQYPFYPQREQRALPLLPRHDEDQQQRARPPHRGHGQRAATCAGRHAPLHRGQRHARALRRGRRREDFLEGKRGGPVAGPSVSGAGGQAFTSEIRSPARRRRAPRSFILVSFRCSPPRRSS